MLPRILVALALIITPALAQAQSQGTPSFSRLNLTGSGSTGDVSGMSVLPTLGNVSRLLKNKFLDNGVSVLDFGASVGTGGDDSAAINAALQAGCAYTQTNPAAKTCKVIFPEPPSGAYNVCASPVTLPGYWSSVYLEGTGAAPTIRIKPDCANPPQQVLYQSLDTGDSSKARVHIDNLTFDGYGLSKYVAYFGYVVGLTSKNSIYRNAAKDGTNVFIGGGYEINIDSTNRIENVNESNHVVYPNRSALPKYNLVTNGSDSWLGVSAIDAKIANYVSNGGNNHFRDAHGWGFNTPIAPYSNDNFAPLYNFVTYGNADLTETVADSPQSCGYVLQSAQQVKFTGSIAGGILTVTAVSSGSILNNYTLTGDGIPPGTQITSLGTGTGGIGTYNINNPSLTTQSQAIGAGVQSGAYITSSMVQGPASFSVVGSIADNVFTPSSVPQYGVFGVGQTLSYNGATATISMDLGNGSYRLVGSPAAATGATITVRACGVVLDQGLQQAVVRNNDFFPVTTTLAPLDNSINQTFTYGNNNDFYTQYGDAPLHAHPPGGDTLTGTPSSSPGGGSTLMSSSPTGNSSLYLSAQGSGSVQLLSNSAMAFSAFANPNAVNLVGTTANSAGFPPVLQAVGADANIALPIVGKGNSGVLTGVFTRAADPTTGDIPPGQCADWNNTTAATFKHVCNFGGTLRSATMN